MKNTLENVEGKRLAKIKVDVKLFSTNVIGK